jgi:hypothetical protein
MKMSWRAVHVQRGSPDAARNADATAHLHITHPFI